MTASNNYEFKAKLLFPPITSLTPPPSFIFRPEKPVQRSLLKFGRHEREKQMQKSCNWSPLFFFQKYHLT